MEEAVGVRVPLKVGGRGVSVGAHRRGRGTSRPWTGEALVVERVVLLLLLEERRQGVARRRALCAAHHGTEGAHLCVTVRVLGRASAWVEGESGEEERESDLRIPGDLQPGLSSTRVLTRRCCAF